MIPALAAVLSKLNGLTCFLAPLLPAPHYSERFTRRKEGVLLGE